MNNNNPKISVVDKELKKSNIKYIFFQFVDINATLRAKISTINHFEELATDGAGFAGFSVPGLGQEPHNPDIKAIPDLNSLTVLPWKRDTVRFASNLFVEGKSWPFCSRTILQNVVNQAKNKGFIYNTGVEPEFFLVKKNDDGTIEPFDSLDTLTKPCYDMKGLTRNLTFLEQLINCVDELGWDTEATDHEDANGQFELNMGYSDCITTSDRLVFHRYMVSTLANQIGAIATFMPKPFINRTGSGAHFHMSLVDQKTGTNIFLDLNDSKKLGLSKIAYYFIGGLLKHARAYCAFTAPTVNSYKRLISGGSLSGTTWAPVYVTYGGNNRTQMLRIPGPGRIENRTVDSACNPYLATAAILAAGLDGIENKIDPGDPNDNNMYKMTSLELKNQNIIRLPNTLEEALMELKHNNVLRDTLGNKFIDYYIEFKLNEWHEYHNNVSQWEIDKYLNLP